MNQLTIFTRFPEPGHTKTRLIPALGAERAARLHRQMAEHTLAQARALQGRQTDQSALARSLVIVVQFTGGSLDQMQTWLGKDLQYQAQTEGDLGDRLAQSIHAAFIAGAATVITIGTDCPDLKTALLEQAFQALQQVDLVLGPAADGGYYLIGLSRWVPELFQGITWSTDAVLTQTMAIAQGLGLAIAHLPTLSDIDRPEDLAFWAQATGKPIPGQAHAV